MAAAAPTANAAEANRSSLSAAHAASTPACQPQAGAACAGYAPMITGHVLANFGGILPISSCEQQFGIACYTADQLRRAYGIDALSRRGITGAGQTIMIVDMVGSPTLQKDLDVYSRAMGLPSTKVTVEHYDGSPAWDYTDPGVQSWAQETTLDVETAHAYAPGAHIVVVLPDPSGFSPMPAALKSALGKGPASVVSFSFGAVESDFYDSTTGYSSLDQLRYAFTDAAARHTTLVASTGDWGAAQMEDSGTLSTGPASAWPATDPLVTSVGGTSLHLSSGGLRTSPDTVWNDSFGASSGGLSDAFARPAYQASVSKAVGGQRGVPDISASADVDGGEWVYGSFTGTPDWAIVGGTSEAAPTVAAIVALADQQAGHKLGNINPALYGLQSTGGYTPRTGLVQVEQGNNSWGGVTGYPAGPGYNLAAGLGTLNAAEFVPALATFGGRR